MLVGVNGAGGSSAIAIPITRDTLPEGDEWFNFVLTGVTNARIRRGTANIVIVDDDAGALPALSVASAIEAEGQQAMQFRFRLSFAAPHDVRFRATTVNGSAIGGTDFQPKNELIVMPSGTTEMLFTVQPMNDQVPESTETFTLVLSEVQGATVATPAITGTIRDTDAADFSGAVAIAVEGTTVTEGSVARFTIRLSRTSSTPITVQYATADGSAVAEADYVAANGTVTFAPGETTKVVEIGVVGDTRFEFDEAFSLVLGNATNARISTPAALGRVMDDDVDSGRGRAVRH